MNKCAKMFVVFYDDKSKRFYDQKIVDCFFLDIVNFGEELLTQMKADYETIKGYIKSNNIENLHSNFTEKLEACPKGRDKEKSQIKFKGKSVQRRAFAFKSSVVTALLKQFRNCT